MTFRTSLTSSGSRADVGSSNNITSGSIANARAIDREYVEKAKAAGITYVELTDEEVRALAEIVREQVWPMMEDRIGKATMDAIRENTRE